MLVSLLVSLLILSFANAGVQRGECYCNVGVCYKRVQGEVVMCTSDEDFNAKRVDENFNGKRVDKDFHTKRVDENFIGKRRVLDDYGCSSQPEGVDDDMVGIALNYACSATLLIFAVQLYRTDTKCEKMKRHAIRTELGMSVGYLTGGLVHHLWGNRAADDTCASTWFYPVFTISYLSMIFSCWSWMNIITTSPRYHITRTIVRAFLALSTVCISIGGFWCQCSLTLYSGNEDECTSTKGGQAMCDRLYNLGEGIFYIFWFVAWFLTTLEIQAMYVPFELSLQCLYNWAATFALLFGPIQIMVVSVLPIVLYVVFEREAREF